MRHLPPTEPVTCDGRILRVPREVFLECLKAHTREEMNALPYERRLEIADEAARRIAARKIELQGTAVVNDPDAAAQIRADRDRRKAEAWAKRQPKAST